MGLVLRSVKGSKLTIAEMDGNLVYLQSLALSGGTSGGTPSGSNTQIQFNDNGAFGGNTGFTFDKTSNHVNLDGSLSATNLVTGYIFSNPKNITGTINIPDGSNALIIGPNISFDPSSDITIGVDADLTIYDPTASGSTFTGNTYESSIGEIWTDNLHVNDFFTISSTTLSNADVLFKIHQPDDYPWAIGLYNDTYSSSTMAFGGWVANDGSTFIGTEINKPLNIYTNAQYFDPTVTISSSGVIVDNSITAVTYYGDGSNLTGIATEFTGNTNTNPISNLWATGEIHANSFYGDGTNITGIIAETNFVTKTKAEIDALIETNTLIPSQFYKITGVDVDLYGGTDIILQAETVRNLSIKGKGIFFNPKYNSLISGYGVWTRFMNVNMYDPNNFFNYNEIIISDQGDIARFKTNGFLEWIAGPWTGVTSVFGDDSGTSCSVSGEIIIPDYKFGDNVIWGGKKWINVYTGDTEIVNEIIGYGNGNNSYGLTASTTGVILSSITVTDGTEIFYSSNIYWDLTGDLGGSGSFNPETNIVALNFNSSVSNGTPITMSYKVSPNGYSTDKYTLDNKWLAISFNGNDYNYVVDEIEYDYVHDKIISRKDVIGNEVSSNYINIEKLSNQNDYDLGNPIKDFQWGNYPNNFGYKSAICYFNDVPYNGQSSIIDDGFADMYDGGNKINTELETNRIPYTHTQLDPNIYDPYEYQPKVPSDLPMDGTVQNGDVYFGTGSNYFTNLYLGLFTMIATDISVNQFGTSGNLGADGDGYTEVDSYTLNSYSEPYTVYVKKVYGQGDPSINHIFIVNTDGTGIDHTYDDVQNDDFDLLTGISGATKIFYLLTSKYPNDGINGGGLITKDKIDEMVNVFLTMVDGQNINDILNIMNSGYTNITSILPIPQTQEFNGVISNKVIDSYLDCLNFMGGKIFGNELNNFSYFAGNIFTPSLDSEISNNYLNNQSRIEACILSKNSFIIENRLINYSIIFDNFLGSEDGNGSSIYSNILIQNSNINYNELINSSTFQNNFNNSSNIDSNKQFNSAIYSNLSDLDSSINSNILVFSQLYRNNVSNSNITSNELQQSSIYGNIVDNGSYIDNNLLINDSYVYNNTLENGSYFANNDMDYGFIYTNELKNESYIAGNNINSNGQIYSNQLKNSYITDNFVVSSFVYYNVLNNESYMTNNNWNSDNEIYRNTLDQGSNISSNTMDGSFINDNYCFGNSRIYGNPISSSFIFDNYLTTNSAIRENSCSGNTYVSYNKLESESEIYANSFGGSQVGHCNLQQYSRINNSELLDSTIYYIDFNHGIIDFQNTDQLNSKNINFLTMKYIDTNVDFTSSTIIYGDYPKTIIKNSAGNPAITYYNASNLLVVDTVNA